MKTNPAPRPINSQATRLPVKNPIPIPINNPAGIAIPSTSFFFFFVFCFAILFFNRYEIDKPDKPQYPNNLRPVSFNQRNNS